MRSRFVPSPAFVLAFIALSLALGGSALAARSLITGKQIKNNSITSDDIKDGSLLAKDFKKGQLRAGAKGDTGAAGAPGAPGKDGRDGTDATPPAPVDRGTIVTPDANGALRSVAVSWVKSAPNTAAVLTLKVTRQTDALSSTFNRKLVSGTHYDDVVLTLYRGGTTSPQAVYDLKGAGFTEVDRNGDEETYTMQPALKYSETTYNPDGSSSQWCFNVQTTEIGCP